MNESVKQYLRYGGVYYKTNTFLLYKGERRRRKTPAFTDEEKVHEREEIKSNPLSNDAKKKSVLKNPWSQFEE